MDGDLILPVSITMSMVAFVLIAVWYVWPRMLEGSPVEALTPILLFHSFRHIGLAFLVTGVTAAPLDPRFAEPAAYGDLLAATLALAAVIALRHRRWFALPLVWVFSVAGTLDLLNAVYQGFRYTPDGALGATYFIPAVIVPALLVTHGLVFAWLVAHHRRRVPVGVVQGGGAGNGPLLRDHARSETQ